MGLNLVLLMGAGAAGTLSRYGLAIAAVRVWGDGFPWGTLIVNVLGSLAFGLLFPVLEGLGRPLSEQSRLVLLTGFMGAFTTLSTFAFETGVMLREGRWGLAAGNLAAHNLLGIGAVLAGLWIGGLLAAR